MKLFKVTKLCVLNLGFFWFDGKNYSLAMVGVGTVAFGYAYSIEYMTG